MRGKAKLLGFGAFDSHVQIRLIEWLLDTQVNRAGNVADLL